MAQFGGNSTRITGQDELENNFTVVVRINTPFWCMITQKTSWVEPEWLPFEFINMFEKGMKSLSVVLVLSDVAARMRWKKIRLRVVNYVLSSMH